MKLLLDFSLATAFWTAQMRGKTGLAVGSELGSLVVCGVLAGAVPHTSLLLFLLRPRSHFCPAITHA
jgi:hypothetical protein